MFKKVFSLVLAVLMLASLACAFTSCNNANKNFKIGVILVGDSSEGYTKAHMDGIQSAITELKLDPSQVIWKYKVEETSACYDAAVDLVGQGCSVIFSNSYGHQDFMCQAAKENPEVTFVAMTGDYAAISGLDNYCNAFTKVFESRFVSGVVAGMKIKELADAGKLTDKNKDANGNVKVGYVGAYTYAEVVSGYTAFYLGIKSVYDKVVMDVQYTFSWFDFDKEATAANLLIDKGCVIIGQHADSEGAPGACETALKNGTTVYSVGYNVDMLGNAPTAALTSATNNWSVYYTEAIKAAMEGKKIPADWAKGYDAAAVNITPLGASCAAGTEAKVNETVAAIKAGTLKVFDVSKFTVGGAAITSNIVDLSYMNWSTMTAIYTGEKVETVIDGAVSESSFRAAPYFALRIDGITELNANQ